MTWLLVTLLALLQAPAATVEGSVTKPGGGEPLAGARVTLTSADPDVKQQLSATTEDDGRFVLINVPKGNYTLTAESVRYGSVAFGQRRPGGPSSTLSLSEGQRLTDIKLSMSPTGTIAGHITGRNGEPVVNASVQAYQSTYRDGKRMLAPVQTTTANDLGEYRLFGLPAGTYLVAAMLADFTPYGPGMSAAMAGATKEMHLSLVQESFQTGVTVRRLLDDGSVQEEAWMPTYYPGTAEPRDATPVNVAAGATMNGVNIAIAPSPVRRVSGQVMVPAGMTARVRLVPMGSSNGFGTVPLTMTGTSFQFLGVKPGLYALLAEDNRNFSSALIPVEVGNRDVENLRIGLRPKTTLRGTVRVENSGGQSAVEAGPAAFLIVLYQGSVELPMTTIAPDPRTGSFVVNNVSPGEYQIQVRPSPYLTLPAEGFTPLPTPSTLLAQGSEGNTLHVKSAKLGQTDVSNGLTITDGTQDTLEILLTKESGSLQGVVVEPGRGNGAGSTVVLVPAVARKNSSLYKSTVADAAGRFRFQGIAAGDYLVFAWSDVETGAWQDPEFMRLFESRGHRVQVTGNSSQDIQISAILNP